MRQILVEHVYVDALKNHKPKCLPTKVLMTTMLLFFAALKIPKKIKSFPSRCNAEVHVAW